jgi:hypothetical protein
LPCQFLFHQLFHIHLSSYHWHYTVSILTASLNRQLKKEKIFHAPTNMEVKGVEVWWMWWSILQILTVNPATRKVLIQVLCHVVTDICQCSVMVEVHSCLCCQRHIFQ